MYVGGILAPWTIGASRWVATDGGSYLGVYWIQDGRLEEQQRWVSDNLASGEGESFAHRDIVTATTYDRAAVWERDEDGVPPFLALAHGYPGLVWMVLERPRDATLVELFEQLKPARWVGTPVAMAVAFTPRPKEPWWPAAAPEVEGVGERLAVACFVECDPRDVWDDLFAPLSAEVPVVLAGPFVPVVPGLDPNFG